MFDEFVTQDGTRAFTRSRVCVRYCTREPLVVLMSSSVVKLRALAREAAAPTPSDGSRGTVSAQDDAEMIEKDLHRAGRQELGVADEDAEAHRAALRRVLQSWCSLRPEIGYVQGLNCIAAALLVLCDHAEDEAVTLLVMLVDRLPADWYLESLMGGRVEVEATLWVYETRHPEFFSVGELRMALHVAVRARPAKFCITLTAPKGPRTARFPGAPARSPCAALTPSRHPRASRLAQTSGWLLSLWVGCLSLECLSVAWYALLTDPVDGGPPGTNLRIVLALLMRAEAQLADSLHAAADDPQSNTYALLMRAAEGLEADELADALAATALSPG